MKPTCLLAFFVCASMLLSGAEPEDNWKPVTCESAKPYRGPKLHQAPVSKVFSDAAGSLDGTLDAAVVKRLEAALNTAFHATKAPSMTVAVGVPGKGMWTRTTNHSSQSNNPTPQKFWFASVGKAFTAVVVLQVVEEKRLKLDDKLVRWFPEYPNAKVITIDHLLTHTSGIYSFQADSGLRAKPGYKSPEELIAVAQTHGNAFCPGEYWSYCNTGYVMLGRIIERIEGRPFHEVVTARIVERLGLKNTKAMAPREIVADLATARPSDPKEATASEETPTTPFAAGPIVASADDMVRFWHGLLGGRLLKPETVRGQFQRLYPMFDRGTFYGRGVMLYDVGDSKTGRFIWLGHSGGAPGIKAVVAYAVETGAYVAVALNNNGSAEATANLLLKALSAPR